MRRGAERRFAGGFHAFPGGRLDPEDARRAGRGRHRRATAALVACAARELFEETGVLLARGAERVGAADRARDRKRAPRRRARVGRVPPRARPRARCRASSRRRGAGSRPSTCRSATTRASSSRRSRRARRPRSGPASSPAAASSRSRRALARWERGELLFFPPNLHAVRVLAAGGAPVARPPPRRRRSARAGSSSRAGSSCARCARRRCRPRPTRTPGSSRPDGGVAVVDPGRARAGRAGAAPRAARRARGGGSPGARGLAHARPPRSRRRRRRRWRTRYRRPGARARARARPRPGRRGRRRCARATSPAAASGVLETPGHAREHLAFLDEESGALALRRSRLDALDHRHRPARGRHGRVRAAARAHAGARAAHALPGARPARAGRGAAARRRTSHHRREREALVVAALARAGRSRRSPRARTPTCPRAVHPVAARSCLAVLEKLVARGQARARDGRFEPA